MAYPTSVNNQITDAQSQSALDTVGAAKPVAVGNLQQVWAHAMGLGFVNAAARQQNGQIVGDALLSEAVRKILTAGPANKTSATEKLL